MTVAKAMARFLETCCGAAFVLLASAGLARAQDTYLVLVTGLGGEESYSISFHSWASALQAAAEKTFGIPRVHITYLGERPERDPSRIDGKATREEIARALGRIATKCRPGDTVAIVLFGHGSGSGDESRLGLPGPDATARDFATWLVPFGLQHVVLVNAASASGDFQKSLAGKNRIVVTSTKSSEERNESVFGRYFSEALSSEVADADKNGRISIMEAFEAAKAQVATEYQKERRLLTEHAVLEDGAGGAVARSTFLGGRSKDLASTVETDPALLALEQERRDLEDKVEALKTTKTALPPGRYEIELERLLLDLAMKTEELRKKRGSPKP